MLIPPDRESACPSGGVRALREGKAEGSFGAGELNECRMLERFFLFGAEGLK